MNPRNGAVIDAAEGRSDAVGTVGTVVGLGVTPLKGAAHSHPRQVVVDRAEVVGDRRWALLELRGASWRVVRTVEVPAMLTVRAHSVADGGLWLELPDGRAFLVATPDGPVVVADYWSRATSVRTAPGPWDEALSDLLGRAVRLAAVERAGGVTYAEPVSLVTTSSLQEVARRAGVGVVDDERFRSTVVVDTPGLPPFVEQNWIGGRLIIGGVELVVRRQLARCGVIRFEPGTGRAVGVDLLRLLATDRTTASGIVFGVGADVVRPGEIAIGDAVHAAEVRE